MARVQKPCGWVHRIWDVPQRYGWRPWDLGHRWRPSGGGTGNSVPSGSWNYRSLSHYFPNFNHSYFIITFFFFCHVCVPIYIIGSIIFILAQFDSLFYLFSHQKHITIKIEIITCVQNHLANHPWQLCPLRNVAPQTGKLAKISE